ncbi:SecY-interacting protein [Pseudoalteromonas sp. SWXJZ94C]|uniref:SecY-interacting protein n=1 Tax=Pseudoalteromonas sp. SWXJZ94C TaxID=2792065 RepID=UPI0018CF5A3B|nr:SecY-interacting protein [Pseudoalteromonas sp. SWXJZ94C]MBH0055618.1 SecY-interacting protein [Pseudoalteromonas sp. SWXJZ94C]
MSVALHLAQLHKQFSEKSLKNTSKYPLMMHDEQWASPCELGEVDEQGFIQWQGTLQQPARSLNDLANALDLSFPADLSTFYGHMYGGSILATIDGHQVELLQAWNEEDFDLLQQNITGHVLMKRKLKQPETVFIGLTDQDDLLVSVLIQTGEVCLEHVGKKTHHVLAANIEEFMKALVG